MLIILYGNIGGGKTTIAKALADKLNFNLIQFDPLSQSVTGKENMYAEDNTFLLSDKEIDKVHRLMRDKAKTLLLLGESVILESMFFKKQREAAVALSEAMNIPFHLIEIVCDEEEAKKRIKNRFEKNSQSAGVSLYLKNKNKLGDELREHLVLDTTNKNVDECVKEVIQRITLYDA